MNLLPRQALRSINFSSTVIRVTGFQYGVRNHSFVHSRQLRVAAGKRRPRSTVFNTTSGQGVKIQNGKEQFPVIDHKVWILRLAHENSYLSWSRNAAICAGVAATVRMVQGADFGVPSTFITGFADLGLVFILYGSCHHVYQAYRLKKALQLTRPEFLWVLAYTIAIGLVYFMLIHSKFNVLSNWS